MKSTEEILEYITGLYNDALDALDVCAEDEEPFYTKTACELNKIIQFIKSK